MMDNNFLFVEKYRPKTVSECILPDRLKKLFQSYVDEKKIPNLLLHGIQGSGKTTIAKAICNEIGLSYIVINGSDENGIDVFRNKIKNYASSMSLSGGSKVIIIDEADYLNANSVQPALRNAIEEFSGHCTFIFTCNYPSRIIDPIHSRCAVIDFNLKKDEKVKIAGLFFKRILSILKEENIEHDESVIAELVKKHFPDFRRILNELQRYSKFGKIDTGILVQISSNNISELMKFLKEKDFNSTRKWVGSNSIEPTTIFRQIYDALYDAMKPECIPHAVIIIAEYQYKSAFCADQEINMTACLTELMTNCEFI